MDISSVNVNLTVFSHEQLQAEGVQSAANQVQYSEYPACGVQYSAVYCG